MNYNLFPKKEVDTAGDSACLPFRSGTFSLIVCQAVLEHVEDPGSAVKEMYRVLKKGGIVYIEIPFFQGFHAVPTDFQHYTISGIENLFREFKVIDKGVLAGPASAVAWTLREFLSITFSFNNLYFYRIFNLIFGWLTVPVKYLDIWLNDNKFSSVILSGFFLVGNK